MYLKCVVDGGPLIHKVLKSRHVMFRIMLWIVTEQDIIATITRVLTENKEQLLKLRYFWLFLLCCTCIAHKHHRIRCHLHQIDCHLFALSYFYYA